MARWDDGRGHRSLRRGGIGDTDRLLVTFMVASSRGSSRWGGALLCGEEYAEATAAKVTEWCKEDRFVGLMGGLGRAGAPLCRLILVFETASVRESNDRCG